MLRNGASDVTDILPTTLDVMPFLLTASTLVDTYLGTADVSFAVLREIERWLAAHLCCLADPRTTQRRLGATEVTLERSQLGMGLQSTRYGQQVLLLDPTGLFADAAAPRRRATIAVD
jgi:hypothetical protein